MVELLLPPPPLLLGKLVTPIILLLDAFTPVGELGARVVDAGGLLQSFERRQRPFLAQLAQLELIFSRRRRRLSLCELQPHVVLVILWARLWLRIGFV